MPFFFSHPLLSGSAGLWSCRPHASSGRSFPEGRVERLLQGNALEALPRATASDREVLLFTLFHRNQLAVHRRGLNFQEGHLDVINYLVVGKACFFPPLKKESSFLQ